MRARDTSLASSIRELCGQDLERIVRQRPFAALAWRNAAKNVRTLATEMIDLGRAGGARVPEGDDMTAGRARTGAKILVPTRPVGSLGAASPPGH